MSVNAAAWEGSCTSRLQGYGVLGFRCLGFFGLWAEGFEGVVRGWLRGVALRAVSGLQALQARRQERWPGDRGAPRSLILHECCIFMWQSSILLIIVGIDHDHASYGRFRNI